MKVPSLTRAVRIVVASIALAGVSSAVLAAQTTGGASAAAGASAPKYPPAARGSQADDLNGVRVPDPYRWLENVVAPDVHAWVSAQNAVTESVLAQSARRRDIRDLVTSAWSYPKTGAPFTAGERLFFYENSGLENQPALYVQERVDASPRVLIDVNAFSKDGLIAIVDQSPSPDGRYLAYVVSTQGSAWHSARVREVRTSQDLNDELHGIKSAPIAWTKDERGFFYVRSDLGRAAGNRLAPDGRDRVFYHRLGAAQSDDRLIYENTEHPEWRLRADVSEDGQYLVITARAGSELQTRIFLIDLDNPRRPNLSAPLVKLFDAGDAMYEFVASEGPVFFIRTSKGAPRTRLVGVDINAPDPSHWTTVVRETYDPLIEVTRVDDRFVAHRLHDAQSVLELYGLDGAARGTVQLPGAGTVTELHGGTESRALYFTFTSFLEPPAPYRYDLDARVVVPYRQSRFPNDTTFARYETTQLFFTSKDGTRVPMFITARRGITLDGTHPTLLSGAGGFDVSSTPAFSAEVAAWLELGGIYAVANVRGGGEFGRAWHAAAMGALKRVAVDDFVAAAEFLINQRYTRPSLLGVSGDGHGALLASAALVRRPALFGAALLDAGVFDMARFTRFAEGPSWIPEYGSPDRPADLKALLAYSPLHGVTPGTAYPATFISVGENDDVVTPVHSYKLAAALQAAQSGTAPILLRVDYDVGHGPGVPTARRIALSADRLTFLLQALRSAR